MGMPKISNPFMKFEPASTYTDGYDHMNAPGLSHKTPAMPGTMYRHPLATLHGDAKPDEFANDLQASFARFRENMNDPEQVKDFGAHLARMSSTNVNQMLAMGHGAMPLMIAQGAASMEMHKALHDSTVAQRTMSSEFSQQEKAMEDSAKKQLSNQDFNAEMSKRAGDSKA